MFFQNNKWFENKNKYIGYFYNGFIDNNNYSKYEGINDYNINFGVNYTNKPIWGRIYNNGNFYIIRFFYFKMVFNI